MKIETHAGNDDDRGRLSITARRLVPGVPGLSLSILIVALSLGGCAGDGSRSSEAFDPSNIPDAVPRAEPHSKYGNPSSYVVFGKRYHTRKSSRGFSERGIASWYGKQFHGRKTSSGERYNMYAMTAAHKSLPLPTYVRVTNLNNGKSAVVRVNDRGPFHRGRIIDLSYAAATKLGVVRHGTARVEVRAIDPSARSAGKGTFLASSAKGDAAGPGHRTGATARARVTPPDRPAKAQSQARLARRTEQTREKRALDAALAATGAHEVTATPPKPKQPRTAATEKALYLQVGAFGDRDNAERLRRRLASHIAGKVRVQSSSGNGSTLYKVRVGPFGSENEASQISAKLVTLGVDRPNPVWN